MKSTDGSDSNVSESESQASLNAALMEEGASPVIQELEAAKISAAGAGQSRIRVMLLLWSLQGGGAERMAVNLAEHLNSKKFDVKVGLLRKTGAYLSGLDPKMIETPRRSKGDPLAFDDQGNQNIFKLKHLLLGSLLAPWQFSRLMHRHKPDVIISFCKGTSIATMAATWIYGRKKLKWIVREGNNTTAVIDDELRNGFLRRLLKALTFFCFRSSDCLLTISKDLQACLEAQMPRKPQMQRTIYNAIEISKIKEKADHNIFRTRTRPFFVSAGRLHTQKAFDILIEAFSVSNVKKTHDLLILGQGPDLRRLEDFSARHRLREQVEFLGWKDNPWAFMAKAEAFVLSSRWEGFGFVVIEAMACGVPVISTDCDFGPRELISQGGEGLLVGVDDVKALAMAMDRVAQEPHLRQEMAQNARNRAESFSIEQIVRSYEDLILELSSKPSAELQTQGL